MKRWFVKFLFLITGFVLIPRSFAESRMTDTVPCDVMFYVDSTRFLLPEIENILHALTFSSNKKPLFASIENLNEIQTFGSLQTEMRKIIDYFYGKPVRMEKNGWDDTLTTRFMHHNFFLYIVATPLGSMIEYQLTLFKKKNIEAGLSSKNLFLMPVYDKCSSVGFFIDPLKKNASREIEKELKKLFPEANAIPILKIESNCPIYQASYFGCANDKVVFDLSNSQDEDTPREDLTFFTRQIDTSGQMNFPQEYSLSFDPFARHVVMLPKKPGLYAIEFSVSDGVSTTKSQRIYLRIVHKPILALNKHYFFSRKFRSIRDYSAGDAIINSGTIRILNSSASPDEWEFFIRPVARDSAYSFISGGKFTLSHFPDADISDDSAAILDSIIQFHFTCNGLHVEAHPKKNYIEFTLKGRSVPGKNEYFLFGRHKTQKIVTEGERITLDIADRYYWDVNFGLSYVVNGFDTGRGPSFKWLNNFNFDLSTPFFKSFIAGVTICFNTGHYLIKSGIFSINYAKREGDQTGLSCRFDNSKPFHYDVGWNYQATLPVYKALDFVLGCKVWLYSSGGKIGFESESYFIKAGFEYCFRRAKLFG
jgi:hypothetical protein